MKQKAVDITLRVWFDADAVIDDVPVIEDVRDWDWSKIVETGAPAVHFVSVLEVHDLGVKQ